MYCITLLLTFICFCVTALQNIVWNVVKKHRSTMIIQAAAGYGRIFLPVAEFFWWPGRIIFPGVGNTGTVQLCFIVDISWPQRCGCTYLSKQLALFYIFFSKYWQTAAGRSLLSIFLQLSQLALIQSYIWEYLHTNIKYCTVKQLSFARTSMYLSLVLSLIILIKIHHWSEVNQKASFFSA